MREHDTVKLTDVELLRMRSGLAWIWRRDRHTAVCWLQTSQHDRHEPPSRALPTYRAIHCSHWPPYRHSSSSNRYITQSITSSFMET